MSSDPVLAAIGRVVVARHAQSLAIAALDTITERLVADDAASRPEVQIEFAGGMLSLRSRKAIERIFRRARESGEATALAASEAALLDAFEQEKERVAQARARLGIAEAQEQAEYCRRSLCSALNVAACTLPTSVAGLRALIEMLGEPGLGDRSHITPALATLRAAARTLLPEGER